MPEDSMEKHCPKNRGAAKQRVFGDASPWRLMASQWHRIGLLQGGGMTTLKGKWKEMNRKWKERKGKWNQIKEKWMDMKGKWKEMRRKFQKCYCVKMCQISFKISLKNCNFRSRQGKSKSSRWEFIGFFFFRLRPSTFDGALRIFFVFVFDLRGRRGRN